MDSKRRLRIWRSRGLRSLFLSLLILSVLSLARWDICLAQEPSGVVEYTLSWPEGKGDPFCFDLPEIQDMMKKAKEYPILLEENIALKENNAKLEEQCKDQSEKAQIQEERRILAEEKVAFYKNMADEYRKLSEKQNEVIERQGKQLQRKKFWDRE